MEEHSEDPAFCLSEVAMLWAIKLNSNIHYSIIIHVLTSSFKIVPSSQCLGKPECLCQQNGQVGFTQYGIDYLNQKERMLPEFWEGWQRGHKHSAPTPSLPPELAEMTKKYKNRRKPGSMMQTKKVYHFLSQKAESLLAFRQMEPM